MMHVIDVALLYAKLGMRVLPIHGVNSDGSCTCANSDTCTSQGKHAIEKGWKKKATTDPDTIKIAFNKYPYANLGIATGKESGITVLDIDGEEGLDAVDALKLPKTPMVITGSGNLHFYFKYVKLKNAVKFMPGFDIRSDDALIVAPPSMHRLQKQYAWDVDNHIDDTPLAEFPKDLVEKVKASKVSLDSKDKIEGRNNTLYSLGGSIRNRGADRELLYASLSAINKQKWPDNPLPDDELEGICKKLMAYEPKKVEENFEPVHIAEFFLHQSELTIKKWRKDFYTYEKNHYELVDDDYFESMLQSFMKKDIRFIKYIGKSKVQQIIRSFNQLEYIIKDNFDMNIRPGMIPLQNGIFSIDKFLKDEDPMHDHSPNFLCTYCLPFNFEENAKCPVFDRIRIDILGNKKNAAVWDEVLGYHICQIKKLENFFMLYGEGGNGKTVLLTVLSSLLGENNVSSVPLESLSSQSFALAETLGKLANIIPELPNIDKANEAIIKAFATKEILTFDRKWKPPISARPTAVLTMATNTLPQFQDKSDGLWRRMILFEITHKVSEEKKDRRLIDPKFWESSGELPGIFNRALQGLKRISIRGRIDETDAMQQRKKEYREELNAVLRFLKDNCKEVKGVYCPTSWAYACYRTILKNEGHRYIQSQTSFVRQARIEIERHGMPYPLSEKKVRVDKYVGRAFENMQIDEFTIHRVNGNN